MHHFFVTPEQVGEDRIYVEGSDVNHMKNVLRIKQGEQIAISDGNNQNYLCALESFDEGRAVLSIQEKRDSDTELRSGLYLFQGLPKSDKMELIVQKAVELGAKEIIPVQTKRSIVKLDAKKSEKKVARWNSISESAAKQAGRSCIPLVRDIMGFTEALSYAKQLDIRLIPYELAEGMAETKEQIQRIKPGESVGIFIGPEGGFAAEEIEKAIEAGAVPITLGKRILRTETAGLAVLSILMFSLEE